MTLGKYRKRRIITGLVVVEILICFAMMAVVWSGAAVPRFRFFYVADTQAEETIQERFSSDGRAATLDLSNVRGEVHIVAQDGDQFAVKAVKEVWGQNEREARAKLQAIEVEMAMEGNVLRVEVHDPEQHTISVGIVIGSRANQVNFEVVVPRQTTVIVGNRDGPVSVQGCAGGVTLVNRYGPVTVEDVTGDIFVKTRDDAIVVRRSGSKEATVELHNSYGTITAQQVTAKSLALDGDNGALGLEDAVVSDVLVLKTRYGGINVEHVQAGALNVETRDDNVRLGDVTVSAKMTLANQYGDIIVRDASAQELDIGSTNGTLSLDEMDIAGALTIETRYVEIDLNDVRAGQLEVKGHDKDITVTDVELDGTLDLYTQYGAIQATRVEATAYTIETKDDPIVLDGCQGPVRLHNKYGSITVENAKEVVLDLVTQDGDISFKGSLSDSADHKIENSYGDVTLYLPSDTAVSLVSSTQYGRVHCEFPVLTESNLDDSEKTGSDVDELRGTINGGGVELGIKTHDGDILINRF